MEKEIDSIREDTYRSVNYLSLSSVDPDETSLGVYPCSGLPDAVLVWVHGGGWVHGDRRRTRRIPEFCSNNNILFISVNYPHSVGAQKSLIEMQLFAMKALSNWLEDNSLSKHFAKAFQNIILVSHSSGSHLVALTDKLYGWTNAVTKIILMDSGAYDLKTRYYRSKPLQRRKFEQLLQLNLYPKSEIDSILASYSPALIPSNQPHHSSRRINIVTSERRGALYAAHQLAKSYSLSKDKVSILKYNWDHDYFPESIGLETSINSLILEAVSHPHSE